MLWKSSATLGVGSSDVLQTLEEGEGRGEGRGGEGRDRAACHDDGSARRCTLHHAFLAPPHHHTSYCSWKRDTPECLFTDDISSTFDLSSEPGNMVYPSNRYSRRARWMKTYCFCRNRGRRGGQGEGQGEGQLDKTPTPDTQVPCAVAAVVYAQGWCFHSHKSRS